MTFSRAFSCRTGTWAIWERVSMATNLTGLKPLRLFSVREFLWRDVSEKSAPSQNWKLPFRDWGYFCRHSEQGSPQFCSSSAWSSWSPGTSLGKYFSVTNIPSV
jgi:hypothetical protein